VEALRLLYSASMLDKQALLNNVAFRKSEADGLLHEAEKLRGENSFLESQLVFVRNDILVLNRQSALQTLQLNEERKQFAASNEEMQVRIQAEQARSATALSQQRDLFNAERMQYAVTIYQHLCEEKSRAVVELAKQQ
jgi:predicted  nucleic acid-binding Zn-ribbon protein